jgi:electron transfer flavoprotein beta subunit
MYIAVKSRLYAGKPARGKGNQALHYVVILKQTFDTEEKIILEDGRIVEEGVKFVINPYDEYAVEAALGLREQHGGSVTVLSAGPERSAEALRTALAMGADEAVLISDERIGTDEFSVSVVLARWLADQQPDLILGGTFSVDNGAGQVAVRIAQLLDIPHVSSVTRLSAIDGRVHCIRDAEGDAETVEAVLPALITAQQGLNEPRYPTLPGIMKAKKKPFRQLTLDDLGLRPDELQPGTQTVGLSLPPARQPGRMLSGTPEEQAAALIRHLREDEKISLTPQS